MVGKNIDKLAGYVLVVEKGDRIRFSPNFLSSDPLPGNLNDFRSELNLNLNELGTLRFHISRFPRDSLPDDSISKIENDIESFFCDFKFAVNQPDEKELAKIIKEELGEEFSVVDAKNVYSRFLEKTLDWMKEREGPAFSDQDAKGFFEEVKREILGSVYFEVRDPVRLFTGREKELEELNRMLQHSYERLSVVSQIKSVSGLGGIGKTQLVRKYVQKYAKVYDENIVWINAETESTLGQSFFDLARDNRLGIRSINIDKSAKPIKSIVKEIYSFFARRKSLFIFDNVDDIQHLKEFLPLSVLRPSDERPYVLITSRNQRWEDQIDCLGLGGLSLEDAVTFVKNGLEIKDELQNKGIEDLVIELQFFPLAIQQAISYIRYHRVTDKLSIVDYLVQYREKKKDLLDFTTFQDIDNEYTKTTFTTWDMTFHKIKNNKEYGDLALEVLYIMAYLGSENINRRMFVGLAGRDESKLKSAVRLLVDYSIVSGEKEQSILSVHKLVQEVVMIKLVDEHKSKEVMKRAVRLINDIGSSFESSSSTESFLLHQEILLSRIDSWIVKNPQDRNEMLQDSLALLLPLLGEEYFKIYKLEEAAECFKRVLEIEEVSDDRNIVKVIEITIDLSKVYKALEEYAEQERILSKIEHNVRNIYKPEGSESDKLGGFLVELGEVRQRLESFDKINIKNLLEEGSSILEKVYTKEHQSDYYELGEVFMSLSKAYEALHDYDGQAKSLDKALVVFSECYGVDSFEAAEVQVEIGKVCINLKKYREARNHIQEAINSPSLYRSDNDRVHMLLCSISEYDDFFDLNSDEIAEYDGVEASYIEDIVLQLERDSLAEAYGLVVLSKVCSCSNDLRFYYIEEAIEIFEKYYQEGSYELAKELINLADAYGDIDQPLKQEKVIQERVLPVLLHEDSHDVSYEVARAQLSLAKAWELLGKYEEQLKLLIEKVLPFFVNKYGNKHFEVAEIQLSIAIAYGRLEKNYAKQINLIEETVLPVLKTIFEELYQSPKIVNVLVELSEAYKHLNNYEKRAECLQNALRYWQLFNSYRSVPLYNYDVLSAKIIVSLSETYGILKQYNKQADLLVEALGILKKHYGPSNEEIIKVRVMMAQAYRNLNQHGQAIEVLNDYFPILNDKSVCRIDLEESDQVIKFLVEYYLDQQNSFQCSEGGKRALDSSSLEHSWGKKTRKERSIGMSCIDSFDDGFENDKYEELTMKLFNNDNRMKKLENTKEFYDQLLEFSERVSGGEIVDIGESLSTRIRNIDLNLIDSEIRDIVKEMQDNVRKKDGVKNVLRRSGVAEKIGKVAEVANLAFAGFLVGKHLVNGNVEDLGYDALNLYLMPKVGEKISGEILGLGKKLDSLMLKGFAPVMRRAIGNFLAFSGLVESIKARQNAKYPVDIKIADLHIATNSIFIAADVPAIVTEIISVAGLEAGVVGEFANPVALALSVAVVVISQLVEAGLEVEKLAEYIKLTDQEKHDLYWDFILDGKFSGNLGYDLEAKQLYEQYIKNFMQKFANIYNRVGISLPSIMVEKRVGSYCFGLSCNTQVQAANIKLIDNGMTFIDSGCFAKFNWSRVIPTVENYTIACGPLDEDIAKDVDQKVLSRSVTMSGDSSVYNIKSMFSFKAYPLYCNNSIVYERTNSSTYHRSMYYIQHQVAEVHFNYNETIDLVFHGSNLSVASNKEINSNVESRYYFSQRMEDCAVHRPGINFFYITESRFSCDLRGSKQKNIILTQGNFTDLYTGQVDSIVGSTKTNYIEVSNAGYVDGKGGNDVITVKNLATIKGYFGDSIDGKGLVLLSINFNDIANMTYAGSVNKIYHKNGGAISIDQQALVKTADGFFVTPTKLDTNTGRVTNLKITKSVDGNIILDDELNALQKIDNSSFDVVKQLSSSNYHITICGFSNCIFYPDEDNHNFYWDAPSNMSHLYLFDQRNANITIANTNGILDFTQLNGTLSSIEFEQDSEGRIRFRKNDLNVVLLPSYKDVTVTFSGEKYYKFQEGRLERDYCSHNLKIYGRFSVNGTDLIKHHNCFTFNSDKVLFFKLNDSLVLLSGKYSLSILNYYSSVQKKWDLSVKLNNGILGPEEFRARADNFSSFRYYHPDGEGLQIYHNQPDNTHSIGLVDLRDKSILDLDIRIVDANLLLLYENNTLVRVENWNYYQPAREMIFAFNDTVVYNLECIISKCSPESVRIEFDLEKVALKGIRERGDIRQSDLNKKEEKPAQRKRRHHHGDHSRHHLSRKPLAINSSNQPEIATSSSIRPSSWINDCISWVKSSVGRLLSSKSEGTASSVSQVDGQFAKGSTSNNSFTGTTLSSNDTDKRQENGGFFRDNVDYVNANLKRMCERQAPVKFKPKGRNTILEMGDHYLSQVDFNGTITLFDLLIRRFTGQKYISTVDQSISPLEAQGYALNITKGFEKVLEQAGLKSGVSMHRLNIDFVGMHKEITGKIMSGKFSKISGILNSYVERACPSREEGYPGKLSPKKFDKFMLEFNKGLLNQSIEQILHNRDGRLEVSGAKQMSLEPQSYLSNASVHSHSEVSNCLSEIGVTKLVGNLNR